MLSIRDARDQLAEVRHIKQTLKGLRLDCAMTDFEGLTRDERQDLLVWLDELQELGQACPPFARHAGRTIRVGSRWRQRVRDQHPIAVVEALLEFTGFREWTSFEEYGWVYENVSRDVVVTRIWLERARSVPEFRVEAEGHWRVVDREVQPTRSECSVGYLVGVFEEVEEAT